MVKRLKKSPKAILRWLVERPEHVDLWHMATGVAGEAGELLDAVKKAAVYDQEIDVQNVIEELGDIEFYMEGIRQNLGITRDTTLVQNKLKLHKRYADFSYSDVRAKLRKDKRPDSKV